MYVKKPNSMPWKDGHNRYETRNGKYFNEILMGTWNAQTMLQPGRTIEIVQEIMKFNLHLVALQEICPKEYYTGSYSPQGKEAGQKIDGLMV
jgi:hypothetical protein